MAEDRDIGTGDRLDWIFDASKADLSARYDEWAATYDDDHDEWGWQGPQQVAEAVLRGGFGQVPVPLIVDAGCGTGRAGAALRERGWDGHLIGFDLSAGMLQVAARRGDYDTLVQASVTDIPLGNASVGAIVSSGVFTHGHVGGDAFAELCRVTAAGGLVTMTQREDLVAAFAVFDKQLVDAGRWEPVERTVPANFHPDRGDTMQSVASWRVSR